MIVNVRNSCREHRSASAEDAPNRRCRPEMCNHCVDGDDARGDGHGDGDGVGVGEEDGRDVVVVTMMLLVMFVLVAMMDAMATTTTVLSKLQTCHIDLTQRLPGDHELVP